jgi:hypothetical protein
MPQENSPAWVLYTSISFATAFGLTLTGLALLPVERWMQAYCFMGVFFLVGSSVTLTKTIRDQQEVKRLRNRIEDAKTERLLREFEPAA